MAGPVFSIIAWILFEKVFLDEKSASQEILSSRIITALKIIFFLTIGTMCIGNAVHIIVDDLNARAFNIAEIQNNPSYADLYFASYFWDEFFGHLAIFVPLFVLMGIFMGGLLLESPSRSLRWFEWLFITLIGIGYGIGWFYGFAEGQATFFLCLINLFLIIFILIAIIKEEKRIRDHPFAWVVLIEALVFVCCTIIWGVVVGIKPYYPFFKQPGEELWI